MPRGGPRPGAGRPPGQPNRDTAARRAALAELLADHVETAIAALAQIAATGQSETARLSAACAILDRTHGRPAQAVDLAGRVDGQGRVVVVDSFATETLDLSQLSTAALEEIVALRDRAAQGR